MTISSIRAADATTGVVILVAGFLLWRRRPASRVGILTVVAGATWFAGTLWPAAAFLHRGALVHVYFAYPTGRLVSKRDKVVVLAAYIASTDWLTRHDGMIVPIWLAIAAAAVVNYMVSSGVARRARIPALAATIGLVAVVELAALNRTLDWRVDRQMLWAYLGGVTVGIIALTVDLARSNWSGAVVTNLVVDLGTDQPADTLEGAIAGALGDPTLRIAYRLPGTDRFVDDLGRDVDVWGNIPRRAVTPISDERELMAYLVHDDAVLDDPTLVAAVAECARLAVSNARMQAATRERVAALDASRRRIVEAGHRQRQRLEEELADGVERRLGRVAGHVRDARDRGSAPLIAVLDDLAAELVAVGHELADLIAGIHPRSLAEGGLGSALSALATRATTPTEVRVAAVAISPLVESTVYFVCCEALTNVVKHSAATLAQIHVEMDEAYVTTTISDNGVGGADLTRGTGLRGLSDRVEALGGRLRIESRAGLGTSVQAIVPTAIVGARLG